ncbi:hypothetical protein E2C01_072278 [Portunus trituberculatus]|uniref:Uncharacterized protein n=1 Tax=Portunus trituberculatus TaxID=210409 RepID=A0A5B7HXJ7_PORTR|nr:hypothetical protein [Portunus trituberculatus]
MSSRSDGLGERCVVVCLDASVLPPASASHNPGVQYELSVSECFMVPGDQCTETKVVQDTGVAAGVVTMYI